MWKRYKIGDVCSISSSKRIFAKDYQAHGIPFFRGKEIIEKQKGEKISTELYISESKYNAIKSKFGVPLKGDMLLTSVGTLGIPYIVEDEEFYFKDGNLTWFKDFKGVNSKFLYYWFLSPIAQVSVDTKSIGSTQKALTIEALRKFEIDLPNIETQKRITSILSSLDDKIELNRRINDNLEQQAQALFKSWFMDFEPFKDGEFVDSELGRIPKGWQTISLSDIAKISKETVYPYKNPNRIYSHYSVPAFDNNNIPESQAGSSIKSNKYKVDKGMILFSKLNPRIKRIWHIIEQEPNSICSSEFIPYVSLQSQDHFLYCYLSSDLFYNKAMSIVNGATGSHQRFSADNTLQFKFPYNHTIAERFNAILAPLQEKIGILSKEMVYLRNLRDTLLPKLMSGELTPADIPTT